MTDRWEMSEAVKVNVLKSLTKGKGWARRWFHSDEEGVFVRFDGFRVWPFQLELMLGDKVVGTVRFPEALGPGDSCTVTPSKDVRGLLKFTIL